MMGKELEFVEWLKQATPDGPRLEVGIGDDMAILRPPGGALLFSSDMMLDGVHFDVRTDDLETIGRKAVACNLSDCAAMAVRPLAITVSVAWPDSLDLAGAQQVYEGMLKIAREFDVAIAGGDTTGWDKPLAIDVAVIAAPYDGIPPVRRDGAKPGDRLHVTGPLGGSRMGKHLSFTPRVAEARSIAQALGSKLHAMIDISDGLALDLHRLCLASKVGAVLDESLLVRLVSDDARSLSRVDGQPPIAHALCDGEDFELLLAIEGGADVPGVELMPVGEVTKEGLHWRRSDGVIEKLEPKGYRH